jgi:hypothetical protein
MGGDAMKQKTRELIQELTDIPKELVLFQCDIDTLEKPKSKKNKDLRRKWLYGR